MWPADLRDGRRHRRYRGHAVQAAQALKDEGAMAKVVAYITHPVLSGNAVDAHFRVALDEMVVTDTIPLSGKRRVAARSRNSASIVCLPRPFAG
jgi:phosphoribosylpyrophosphate synthetase